MKKSTRKRAHDALDKASTKKTKSSTAPSWAGPVSRRKGEIKFVDTFGFNLVDTVGSVITLNVPTPGTNFYNRVGNSIINKTLRVMGWFTIDNGANTSQVDLLRVAIVYDRQPNASAPGFSTIFTDVSNAGALSSLATCGINPVESERFRILRDKRVISPYMLMNGATTSVQFQYTDPNPHYIIDEFIRLPSMETRFNTTNGGTIADITSGALYLVFYSSVNAANASQITFNYSVRLRFTD